MWTIFLKSLLNSLPYCFFFFPHFGYFGLQASETLAAWLGIEHVPLELESEVLTTGPPGKSL